MKKQTYKDFIRDISNKATKFTLSIWYFIVNNICELYTTFFNNLSHILVIKKQCFCPSDCESTKYIFETSFSPRSSNDTALLIKSYSKKNKLMYNVTKEIQKLNNLCISSDEKEQRIQEFEQLNHSIAYTCSVLHFFWKEDIMVSYKRDERYTIVDMLCKLILFMLQ